MHWDRIIDEAELAAAMPGSYGRFARPIREALVAFLSGLPTLVQLDMFRAQAQLGAAAPLAPRLGALAKLSPVLHKLGQILARDQRLATELRTELQHLEMLPPSATKATVETALFRELGPLASHDIELAPEPVAEASVASNHPDAPL